MNNLVFHSIYTTFSLCEKVLSFGNKNKNMFFCFVLCSLIRTFAPANEEVYRHIGSSSWAGGLWQQTTEGGGAVQDEGALRVSEGETGEGATGLGTY